MSVKTTFLSRTSFFAFCLVRIGSIQAEVILKWYFRLQKLPFLCAGAASEAAAGSHACAIQVESYNGEVYNYLLKFSYGAVIFQACMKTSTRVLRAAGVKPERWVFRLLFQIKELTGNLNRNSSSSSLSSGPSGPESDTSHPSTPSVERNMSITVKDQRKAIRALLIWVQRKTRK